MELDETRRSEVRAATVCPKAAVAFEFFANVDCNTLP
jgi:hypothetical protein